MVLYWAQCNVYDSNSRDRIVEFMERIIGSSILDYKCHIYLLGTLIVAPWASGCPSIDKTSDSDLYDYQ